MFAISIASGGALTSWLRHAMSAEFDQSLLVNAHALQSLVALRPDGSMDVDVNLRSLGEFTGRSATDYFAFEDLDGHQIAASDHAVIRGPSNAHSTFWNAQLPNGVAARAMQITFQPAPEADEDEPASGPTIKLATPTLRLVVAHDRRPLDSILSRMTLAVGAATLVFSAVAVIASVLMVRRGLSSLRMLATEVAAADVTKAPVHFSTAERPTELVPIVGRLNELLDRVSVALTRERQFTAAVSHELRTPIAELRSIADISLREPEDVPLARRAVVQSHEIALQMQTLVSTLLSIVAVGRSGESVAITDTPVRPLLERAIEKRSADFRARGLTVTFAVPTDVTVQANPTLLAGVFDNVLSNAVQYATAGSEVVVDLQLLSDHTVFTFSNQQHGLGKEDISRVFDPFWRKDAARSSGEHVGLGLALVQTYAKAMDGVVSATLEDDDRYSISIRLPRTATELHDLAPTTSRISSRGGGRMMWARSATLLLASLTVVGCATYEPSPLSRDVVERALQPLDRATLAARAKALRNPLIAAEGFDPEAPVTPGSAAVVAVLSHPTLLAARDRVPVAEAQVLQAGILPNPALTFGLDVPVGSNTNGEVVGYGLGIDWEITALISRGAKVASARAATEQIRLDLSWKEWQVAQAARQAVYDVIALKSKERDAATLLDRLTSVASKADAALAHHDLKATDATAARAAADESRVALAGIRRDLTDAMLTLKQAMGLPADAPIVLDGSVSLPDHLTVDDADRFAANLENRRIDLVALRRGYDSQESTVRAAILSQFPKFSLGLAQNRDTGDFLTVGPSIALEIPVFDHNQSAIAIEKATRQQLLDEYVGRVFEARADVARAIALIRSLNAVIEAEATQVATLCELVSADEAALTHGNLDIATYYAAAVSLSQKQAEFTSLKLDLVHAWISLELAAGARIDPVEQPSTAPVKEDR